MTELINIAIGAAVGVLSLIFLKYISSGKGIYYWKRYYKTLFLIQQFYHGKCEKKLPTYENLKKADFTAADVGIIPTESEYVLENQCKDTFQHCDGIHFFGVDCGKKWMDVCINKIEKNVATVWIFLKLSNGEEYRLPGGCDMRTSYIDSEYSFSASGLQIRCISPLRKWRVSFNGLLQKCNAEKGDENDAELIHVRFSFIWISMALARQSNIDFNSKDLAKAFADASYDICFGDLKCFHDMQNRYEQWGQLMGTLCIKGKEEEELYLWSCRTRILDNPPCDEDISYAKFYMYFKDGYPLKVETTSIKNFISNFTMAHTIYPTGGLEDITDCDFDLKLLQENARKISFSFKFRKEKRTSTIEFTGSGKHIHIGPKLEITMILKPFKVTLDNGDEGFGVLHFGMRIKQWAIPKLSWFHSSNDLRHEMCRDLGVRARCPQPLNLSPLLSRHDLPYILKIPPVLLIDKKNQCENKMVLLLSDDNCKSSLVAGGKGCSLALLTEWSKTAPLFHVPKGFVITTSAFERHIQNNKMINYTIQRLVDVSGEKVSGDLKDECLKCMEEFQSLKISDNLREDIQDMLLSLCDSVEHVRFSVRSSACGEDSEDLSAAGQMLTVLGVRGINNIIDAVVKCWSSKFGYEAVQYARQNGQSIKSSMAVVIQEMVPSEVSGVMFTVDPVTGDPSHPYITANYGLGETVVSSLADPDTFILQRNPDNSISIKEKIIGTKKVQIHMNAEEGTEQENLDCESLSTCLTEEWAVKIGSVGILVENSFCKPLDIEWALYKDRLHLLQARPITTLHTETDFELIHDQDTPQKSETEFWTRANTGEVFLGATSPLGISLVVGGMDIHSHRGQVIRERLSTDKFCPYYSHILPVTHRQVTISIIDTLYRSNQKEITNFQKAFEVGIFGRVVATEEMHKAGIKRYGYMSKWKQLMGFTFLFLLSYKVPKQIKNINEKIKAYNFPMDSFTNIPNTWKGLLSQMLFYNEVTLVHGMATYMSSFFNLLVIHTLAKGKEVWDSELYCDFASVLSACTGIESADVPESLQVLAQVIAKQHGATFSALTDEMAYQALKNDEGPSGKLFKEFLQKHGHRCIKEFDVYSTSWAMNPKDLIHILQNLAATSNILTLQPKKEISIETEISKLNTPLKTSTRKVLKLILPWSREAVRQREQTKSLVIKTVDWLRQTCLQLAKLMVEDGMLPDKQLIFFLTLDEIKEMIDTRRPGLVSKAMRRSRLHPKLDKLQFPEIITGIPKAVEEEDDDLSKYSSSFTLKGIPVCQGKVRGIARVVSTISEARTIQSGDILITNSTDIGWSPYFPLLSGVVTVLGGLISHGAVVAREYGLPCVVGVQKAMSAFKSGDIVILDGTKGIISKVTSDDMDSNEL